MPRSLEKIIAFLSAASMLSFPCLAYQTPLSDESIREAYFLGQRHDESMAALLKKYTKVLPAPKSGPYIYSVTFLTPFAFLVQYSSQQMEYSAQRAALDHKSHGETVEISIDISLTESYGPFITKPAHTASGDLIGTGFRSPAFWRAFKFEVFDGHEEITTDDVSGKPRYFCTYRGPCSLSGATITLRFPADAFYSHYATIQVVPPEGDTVSVDFDLTRLR
jgi:hypothetical protein